MRADRESLSFYYRDFTPAFKGFSFNMDYIDPAAHDLPGLIAPIPRYGVVTSLRIVHMIQKHDDLVSPKNLDGEGNGPRCRLAPSDARFLIFQGIDPALEDFKRTQ